MSGGTPAEAEIRYDGQDITDLCVIKESTFTSRAGGVAPGDCTVAFRDVRQRWRFQKGKTLELYIGGVREWDGYLISTGYNYWFATHTANCEPCPHVTPRKLILRGADRNILWTRRVLYTKADPFDAAQTIWPANTPDNTVLIDGMTAWLDQVDGLDYTSMIQNVGSPDPYAEFRVPGATRYWGDLFREVAQSTGAVFYIDPARKVVYADVETPNAPFGVSDRPTSGQKGYRDLEILEDAGNMINDAMIWGAGQGSDQMTFARVEDPTSIALHGRWQNTGGYHTNLYEQASVNRAADSIVNGSPSSLRGHKDNKRTVNFTVFEPGLRVAQKVVVESESHGWTDTLPIRQMTIRFHTKEQAEYAVTAGHELDEPWMTSEYYWPDTRQPRTEPPERECRVARYEDSGIAYASGNGPEPDIGDVMGTHVHRKGALRYWGVTIEPGPVNVWQWFGNNNEDVCPVPGNSLGIGGGAQFRAQVGWADWFPYPGTASPPYRTGEPIQSFATLYNRYTAPINYKWPGSGLYAHITGSLWLEGYEVLRAMDGWAFPIAGAAYAGQTPAPPQLVQLLMLRASAECHPAWVTGVALVEGTLECFGDGAEFSATIHVPDNHRFHLAATIAELKRELPILEDLVVFGTWSIEYTLAKPSGGFLIGRDDPEPCVPVPLYGDYCGATYQLTPTLYRTPSPYSPGSTKVYLDGIHQRLGEDYEETDPDVGRFTFDSAPIGDVTACYVATGIWEPMLPDTSTALFVIPTPGSISGTFGARGDVWPGAFWHGQWFDHFHNGVDFGVSIGTPVYAAAAGTVVFEDQAAGGTMIHVYHDFHGMRTTYAHLSGRVAPNYSTVTQGQLIGYSGDSGNVTGGHLHWGLVVNGSPEDPMPYADYSMRPPDLEF